MIGDRGIVSTRPPDLATRRKRLIFRAWHRGMREADLILGRFVEAHVAGWSEAEIAWFERLLAEPDADILAWITGRAAAPAEFDTPLMRALQALDYLPRDD